MVRYNADFIQSSDEDQEEKQNSNKEEVANIATRSNSVEELLAELITETERSSYTRIYSRTRVELTTIDYTWTIEKFMYFSASVCTLLSPPFAEDNQYSIQMNISRPVDSPLNTTQFYMRTNTELTGSCTTTVKCCSDTVLVTKSISGCLRDMTLLIEIWNYAYVCVETLTVECKFVLFHEAISNSINMNLLPPPVIYKKCVKRSEDSKGSTEERGKFKFVVGDESYLIPKHLLRAINSAYFNNVCLTLNENEKDMTNELTECELQSFKQMLAFILTGSVGTYDYDMLKTLLMTADKYGVTSLKLACQHCLLCYITTKNAIELLQLALSCTAAVLEEHSAAFIKFHMKEMNSEEFESLPPEDLNKIMNPIEKCHIPEISTRNFCYREK